MGLESYEIGETIAQSDRTLVRRARRRGDGSLVVVKSLRKEYPSAHEIGQLEFEHRILRHLSAPGVIRAVALERDEARPALVLEDFGGEPLPSLAGGERELTRFFPIAIAVVRALGALHAQNVVHRDVKPRNVVWNQKTGEVKLIDFSIASELSQERQALEPQQLEGSLPYMSPEQTGRMNRDADYRTDYYSLGVTFFELLTGTLPFSADDVMGWLHCHISKRPPKVRELNPAVPEALSCIVDKLLAKDPGDRYQSAHGLARDLERCEREWTARRAVPEFALGEHDVRERFEVSQRLFGREAEAAKLLETFEATSRGPAKLLLVAGHSGVGKSALIQEIHRAIVERRGKFIAGKFDQLDRNVPYGALVHAVRGLVRQLLAEPEERLQAWRRTLDAALEPNGQALIALVPELERVIGRQPAVAELSPRESQARLQRVFREMLRAVARPDHPLVVFIDDLQWTDAATPELLVHLLSDASLQHLLIIGTYRDNEVDHGHPLMLALQELEAQRPDAIDRIALAPLAEESVNRIVADTLACDPADTRPLGALIAERTAGNPFFVKELLGMLSRDGAFRFAADEGRWEWDLEKIRAAAVRDNVVDLMVERLQRLPPSTTEALRLAACVGNEFDLQTLARSAGRPAGELAAALWEAVRQRVVTPLGGGYRLVDRDREYDSAGLETLAVRYRFLHDRVQQAAYSLLDAGERARVHVAIGRHLLASSDDAEREERLFEIVTHLNRGRELIAAGAERAQLARLNEAAARKARRAAAYAIAVAHFETAVALLTPDDRAADPRRVFDCRLGRVECIYLSGDADRASALCDELLAEAADVPSAVAAAELKARILDQQGRFLDAIATIRSALKQLDVALPEDPAEIDRGIGEGIGVMQRHLARVRIEDFVRLPRMTDERRKMAMALLFQIVPPAIQGYPPLFILAELMMFDLALTHGTTAATCKNFVDCGIIQGGILGDYDAAYRLGKVAFALLESYAPTPLECSVHFVFAAFVSHWRAPYREGFAEYAEAARKGPELGDLPHTAYTRTHHAQRLFMVGRPLDEADAFCEAAAKYLKQIHATGQLAGLDVPRRALAQLRRTAAETYLLEDVEAFTRRMVATGNAQYLYTYGESQLTVAVVLGELGAAERWVKFTEPYLPSGASLFSFPSYWLMRALVAAKKHGRAADGDRGALLEEVNASVAKLKTWAGNSPENYARMLKLALAEQARIRGEPMDRVLALYDDAIDAAGADFLHLRALANELQAEYWLQSKRPNVARSFLQEAHYVYQRWGAIEKVERLQRLYPWLGAPAAAGPQTTSAHTIARDGGAIAPLDVMSMIKATQAISGEVKAERLFDRLMATILENAGAQRGSLVVRSELTGELHVEATAAVGGGAGRSSRHVRLDDCNDLCRDLVRYVARTCDTVVLADALHDERYREDTYVRDHAVRSVLCIPITRGGRLVAILYAENNVATRAFSSDRIELLQVIASQAAISITNAQLYDGLEAKVAERTEALAQRERALQLVLDSTGDGLLSVGLDGAVDPVRSRAAAVWFGDPQTPPEKVWMLLHADDAQAALLTRLSFDQLVGTDLPFELTAAQMPARLRRGECTLELAWRPVTERGTLKRVLVVARDITDRLEAERAEQDARELQDMVGSVLRDKAGFANGIAEARTLLGAVAAGGDGGTIRRALHTLKGNAAMFGLHQLSKACHELEDAFVDSPDALTPERVEALRARLEASLGRVREVFGGDFLSLVEVRERDVQRLLEGLERREEHAALAAFVFSWRDESVDAVLHRFGHQAQRIAASLGKELDVTVDERGTRVPAEELRGFWSGLVHAVRNAVDHGIETAAEREAAGKAPRGRLVLRAFLEGPALTVQVEDDGRGIDFERLREAAARRGLPAATREDLIEAMFADGVTTKSEISTLSGRGVGMAALKRACHELGGSVAVESRPGSGTSFTFRVPLRRAAAAPWSTAAE